MKVYEIGKELGIDNKVIIDFLQAEGVDIKNHLSIIPDKYVKKLKEKYGKSENKSQSSGIAGIKAVALPGGIIKKAEQEAKAKTEVEIPEPEEKSVSAVAPKTADPEIEAKKKKKPAAVFNPQYSAAFKAKPQAQNNQGRQQSQQTIAQVKETPKPAPRKFISAKDRKPDDYVEPEVEVKVNEPVKEVVAANPVAEPVKTDNKPEVAPKSEKKQEIASKTEKKAEITSKDEDAKTKTSEKKTENSQTQSGRPGESEAIKSLRDRLVKGTINPVDLLGSSSKPGNKKSGQDGSRQNTNGSGKKYNNQNQNGYNKNGQNGGKDFNKNNQGQNQGQFQGRNQNSSNQGGGGSASAPVIESGKGKGKGGKPQKGKYDKSSKGDKFDRLENEKAAQRVAKVVNPEPEEEEIKVITLPETIELKDFAAKLKMQPAALIKKLFLEGKVLTLNDVLDFETAEAIALDMEIICEHEVVVDYIEELLKEEEDAAETLVKRPPVVCIMGHVDHGKTSLLDAIRKTNVTSREAGGITQHIGAYTVEINGESITFLDTPGHEAFTAMRMRGAKSTDVAILVVAADDGVMPQTVEAINHAKAAGIHVIVAVNKIDKPAANIDKVKQELSDLGLIPEDWGGSTIFAPVSAKTGEGIENLLEMVILDTEILELKANPNRKARGIVIEAKLDKGRGSVATLLVQKGTLKVGDHVAIGEAYGKVRAMTNDKGAKINAATPSTPIEITGLNGVPNAGEVFVAFDNDKDAKQFSQVYIAENKKKLLAGSKKRMNLDDVFDQMKAGELKELNVIVKADVQGSVEAIKESLEKLSNDEIIVKCIHSGAGNVSASDAILASASNAIIIAFNVGVNPDAKDTIEHEKVDMRTYSVIYNAIDDVENAMKGLLEPIYEEVVIGHVEVRQTFKASGIGIIAGSYVTDGVVKRNSKVRLNRDGETLFDGDIASLKRFNDDAKEVKSGYECGIVLKDFQDIKEGDTMEVYEMKEIPRQ